MTEQLTSKQYDLELSMRDAGTSSYLKEVFKAREDENEINTSYGSSLLHHNINKVSGAIRKCIDDSDTKEGYKGYGGLAVRYLKELPTDVSALIALSCVIDNLTADPTLTAVAIQIGAQIDDEIRFSILRRDHPGLFRKLLDQTKSSTSHRHRRAVYIQAMRKSNIAEDRLSTSNKLHIGAKLIDIIISSTGLVNIHSKVRRGKHTSKYLIADDKLMKWIDDYVAKQSLMSPKLLPCVIPPVPWTGTVGGGYHYPEFTGYIPLVKARNKKHRDLLERNSHKLRRVYKAVNAMQETAWNVNNDVLDVVKVLWDQGGDIAGLPNRESEPLPPRPEDIDYNQDSLKAWKRKATKVHEYNNRLKSKRLETSKILWIADKFAYDEAIYFPYQLDFRGRCYALPIYFTPQGNDLSKGLLRFAEGKPLGSFEAVMSLAVHGANCYGYDKASLKDRYEFINAKSNLISATAKDPFSNKWWLEADEPISFLAFVYEWAGYLEEGVSFRSRLPIAMDASCSGIQHFSALTRDEEGGHAVNLTPQEHKADIYQEVCNVFIQMLTKDLESKDLFPKNSDKDDASSKNIIKSEAAKYWLELSPDRSTTKRQVMVLPYGGTMFSCTEYTNEWLETKRLGQVKWPEENHKLFVMYGSNLIWSAIRQVVFGARITMDWLQNSVSTLYKEGHDAGIQWTTPVGFPVYQLYNSTKAKQVKTTLQNMYVRLNLREGTDKIDKVRMKNSISPNFIHSLDAAHLMMSINQAKDEGIHSFAMIHDSFGTHACDTHKFSSILRNEFVDMYDKNNVLGDLFSSLKDLCNDIPSPPATGNLDLKNVKDSEYFFS